jgi:hypothetical protein
MFENIEEPVSHNLVALRLEVRDAYVERIFLIIEKVSEVMKIRAIDFAASLVGCLVQLP